MSAGACFRGMAAASLFFGVLHAETMQEGGNRLIRECLKAVGGQAFLNMRNRVQRGRAYQFYEERLSGFAVMTLYVRYDTPTPAPAVDWIGVRERRMIGKNNDYGVLFANGKGYEITFRGAKMLPESSITLYLDRLRRDIFYILKYRMNEPGMIFELLSEDIVDNRPVDTIRITDVQDRTVMVSLHQSDHLPLREEFVRRDPKTHEVFHEVTKYSNYRNVAGVALPYYSQQMRDDEKIFEMFAESVEINQEVKDSLFELQPGVKILPPEKQQN